MFVWKAISSMFLRILVMSSLADLMVSMETSRVLMCSAPASADWRVSAAVCLALTALSALRLVMLAISSREELVS